MEKNGTEASPETAFAMRVLPVPGGPVRSAPRGILPPRSLNLSGSRRYSTISFISSFASSQPATSSNLVRFSLGSIMRARLLPNWMAPEPAPWIWRVKMK